MGSWLLAKMKQEDMQAGMQTLNSVSSYSSLSSFIYDEDDFGDIMDKNSGSNSDSSNNNDKNITDGIVNEDQSVIAVPFDVAKFSYESIPVNIGVKRNVGAISPGSNTASFVHDDMEDRVELPSMRRSRSYSQEMPVPTSKSISKDNQRTLSTTLVAKVTGADECIINITCSSNKTKGTVKSFESFKFVG